MAIGQSPSGTPSPVAGDIEACAMKIERDRSEAEDGGEETRAGPVPRAPAREEPRREAAGEAREEEQAVEGPAVDPEPGAGHDDHLEDERDRDHERPRSDPDQLPPPGGQAPGCSVGEGWARSSGRTAAPAAPVTA